MNPAVRDPKGSCIEESTCDWEKATLCAFSNSSVANRVSFLSCMDEQPSSSRRLLGGGGGGGGGSALDAAKKCAPGSQTDPSSIEQCFDGEQGEQLLAQASKVFNKAFPKAASVPHTNVNGNQVDASYSALAQALCKAGSKAPSCAHSEIRTCMI